MVDLTPLLPYLLISILAAFPAPYLHEGSHWFVGWVCGTKPRFEWAFLGLPNGVGH